MLLVVLCETKGQGVHRHGTQGVVLRLEATGGADGSRPGSRASPGIRSVPRVRLRSGASRPARAGRTPQDRSADPAPAAMRLPACQRQSMTCRISPVSGGGAEIVTHPPGRTDCRRRGGRAQPGGRARLAPARQQQAILGRAPAEVPLWEGRPCAEAMSRREWPPRQLEEQHPPSQEQKCACWQSRRLLW